MEHPPPPGRNLVRVRILMVRETGTDVPALISTPETVSAYADSLRDYDRECFAVILLTAKNRAIGLNECSVGTIDAALVSPANVFKPAILANAAAVVLVHNHPSGDPAASAEDLRITRQLLDAGRHLGVRVLDHVILGADGKYSSLRESGMVAFDG